MGRPPVPATPRAAARELDRLSRAAHRFHRFAHHPLCDEYASEVIRIGRRTRVCRGCATALAGAVAGVVIALVGRSVTPLVALTVAAAGGLAGAASFALRDRVRPAKWLTRGLPACALAFGAASGARAGGALGVGVTAATIVGLAGNLALYRLRKPDRSPCASCRERESVTPCRGLRPIVARERAFQRRVRSVLAAAGATPRGWTVTSSDPDGSWSSAWDAEREMLAVTGPHGAASHRSQIEPRR
ncbi:MAG: hypothetical protein IPK07_34020 [Deltaproteobacteria bacterium]|nr:hypothetical protein [Deltaproteobacteria bacterium]